MTKDRARKRAAHERANRTGESYVVARRTLDEPVADERAMRAVTRVLHNWTHRMPGVPSHRPRTARRAASRVEVNPTRTHKHPARAVREPHVLVEWQNWIARRVGALPPKS